MSEQEKKLDGPDFAQGVPFGNLAEGSMIVGHVAGEAVVLARTGGALFAIGAECTHYHGPLAEGMLVADTVRCPWHHAWPKSLSWQVATLFTRRPSRRCSWRRREAGRARDRLESHGAIDRHG